MLLKVEAIKKQNRLSEIPCMMETKNCTQKSGLGKFFKFFCLYEKSRLFINI